MIKIIPRYSNAEKLSSGRKYLAGDNLTAADITLAALASPILRPENHPYYSSKIKHLPQEMGLIIEYLRHTLAGKFALKLYKKQRILMPT